MRVKVCGLTREEDVALAVDAGADALGFICGFPLSPRNVPLARAAELVGRVPPFVDTVLVTTKGEVDSNLGLVKKVNPSALQLYGGELPRSLREELGVKLILPYRVGGGDAFPAAGDFDAILSDTYVRGKDGGTGVASDWGECRALRESIGDTPFILSGGLNPSNVKEAVERVGPFAVDVSSGVEAAPGVKDPAKVRAFVASAREGKS